jgi:hypothetical protein
MAMLIIGWCDKKERWLTNESINVESKIIFYHEKYYKVSKHFKIQ